MWPTATAVGKLELKILAKPRQGRHSGDLRDGSVATTVAQRFSALDCSTAELAVGHNLPPLVGLKAAPIHSIRAPVSYTGEVPESARGGRVYVRFWPAMSRQPLDTDTYRF